ncbi:MAG: sigma-70 family RNA polymerase sigma factor [Myxococcota bacterium]
MRAAQSGSVEAFTQLVAKYRPSLFRFLLTRTRSQADAEDALQDTFLNAFRYLRSYDAKWRFNTWLYRIAVRSALKARGLDFAELAEVQDPGGDPLAQLEAASERANLWASARRLLSEEVFTAMWLRYVEDMSHREIAETLDRTVSWTKVNLLRARNALDAELSRPGGEAHG